MIPILASDTTFTLPMGLAALFALIGLLAAIFDKDKPAVICMGVAVLLLCYPR